MQLQPDVEQNTDVCYFSQEKIEFDWVNASYFGALPQLSMFS
jgi:hypothetical protein